MSLPLDAVTRRLAWLGTVGSGKTYGATKLAELMIEAGVQIVVLDPVGVWHGLRLARDGKKPGIPIPVFGGLHGDVPLESTGGKLVADLIVDHGLSLVVDVSQFEHDTDKARFGTDFASRFFFRKKASPSAVHLFLEEAQEFIPQNPEGGEKMMLHAFNRMWKIGRNFGIGGSIISQRPQEVNKKALNLSQCLFVFQTMGKHEREAIESWIEDKALDLDIANDLPKLKVGEPHVWAPAWLGISERVKISEKWTFDASETPEVGKSAVVRHLAKIEMEKISEAMKDTVERFKESDPIVLKKRIRELEAKVKSIPTGKVDESVITRAMERATAEARKENIIELRASQQKVVKQQQIIKKAVEVLLSAPSTSVETSLIGKPAPREIIRPEIKKPTVSVSTNRRQDIEIQTGEIKLRKGARAMLAALVQWSPNGMSEGQMRSHAGLKNSGTYSAYKTDLRTYGFMEERGGELYATEKAIEYLGHDVPAPSTTQDVLDVWMPKLRLGARRMLEVLLKYNGDWITDEQLQEETNLTNSGTYSAYKTDLRTARLILVERGRVAANKETLFL